MRGRAEGSGFADGKGLPIGDVVADAQPGGHYLVVEMGVARLYVEYDPTTGIRLTVMPTGLEDFADPSFSASLTTDELHLAFDRASACAEDAEAEENRRLMWEEEQRRATFLDDYGY